jgi:hypothetical protein
VIRERGWLQRPDPNVPKKNAKKKPPEGGFFKCSDKPITWKQQMQEQQLLKQQVLVQQEQQVLVREQPQERVLVQELLLFCHKRPKQKQR